MAEIHERHDAVQEVEKGLVLLQEVFSVRFGKFHQSTIAKQPRECETTVAVRDVRRAWCCCRRSSR